MAVPCTVVQELTRPTGTLIKRTSWPNSVIDADVDDEGRALLTMTAKGRSDTFLVR